VVAILGAVGATITLVEILPIQLLERQTYTLFFQLRGAVPPPESLMILTIDQQSLEAPDTYRHDTSKQRVVNLMPPDRRREAYAVAIDRLMQAGAKTVAIDLLLRDPGKNEAADRLLRQVLQRYAGKVTLAAFYQQSNQAEGLYFEPIQPILTLITPQTSLGFTNYLVFDGDGRIWQLGNQYQKQVEKSQSTVLMPSFAEATLASAQMKYPSLRGSYIFFYGSAETTFNTISFWKILADDWWGDPDWRQQFQNKLILIGQTTLESRKVATPFGEMSTVELHANAIATLMENRAIADLFPHPCSRSLFVLGFIVFAGIVYHQPRRLEQQLMVGMGMAVLWAGIAYGLFTYHFLILPTVVPITLLTLASFSHFVIQMIGEQLEKIRLKSAMEHYIAAPVVKEILKQPRDSFQKGRKLKAAVLFADIRGFTTLSAQLPPEQLIEQLNAYFSAMVQVILETGGTVDKFIGDAIMAEFGFPVSQGETTDALHAIQSAIKMRRALVQLRQQFHHRGWVPFFNGIGISYGEVIAGDIGSLQRREYGVIGDTVNTASRVEGLTKEFRTDILITGSVYDLVDQEVEAIFLGEHLLRGQLHKTRLYSVIGLAPGDRRLYHQACEELRTYLNRG